MSSDEGGGYHDPMIALGIDPGTATCGFGVVALEDGKLRLVDAGCVRTHATETDAQRLRQIHQALTGLIEQHRPERVGIERLFFQRNVQTAMTVGQARGVALLVAAEHELHIDEPTPNEVKQAVCGNGAADKATGGDHGRAPPRRLAGRRRRRRDRCPGDRDRLLLPGRRGAAGGHRVIGSLRGRVANIAQDHALIEVGGIGYRVMAGPALLAKLRVGGEASVYTHHLVREDLQALFGFASPEELAFFELLMTVSQVGPRLALAITAAYPVVKLQLAIVNDEVDLFTSVSGVGRKTAQRIILELKEKVHAAGIAGGVGSTDSDVVAALESLGYTASEARRAPAPWPAPRGARCAHQGRSPGAGPLAVTLTRGAGRGRSGRRAAAGRCRRARGHRPR